MATRIVRPDTAFPLSAGKAKRPRVTAGEHLKFIRSLPCLISGREDDTHAAHIRYASYPHGKRETGAGEKPDDKWTVPLHSSHHLGGKDAQHSNGERRWWLAHSIDPLVIAALLWAASGDEDAGRQICAAARELHRWTGGR